jgi:hypothetical protein
VGGFGRVRRVDSVPGVLTTRIENALKLVSYRTSIEAYHYSTSSQELDKLLRSLRSSPAVVCAAPNSQAPEAGSIGFGLRQPISPEPMGPFAMDAHIGHSYRSADS